MASQLTFLPAIPNHYADLPPAAKPVHPLVHAVAHHLKLRQQTASAMQCPRCRRDLWITDSGYLVCSDFNCGKLIQITSHEVLRYQCGRSVERLREAWPERVIESRKPERRPGA